MKSAIDYAIWLIAKNTIEMKKYESEDASFNSIDHITHLKLQKLLYYAQGIHLSINDSPLFEEEIMVWQHGPVVEEVYQEYKSYGAKPIEMDLEDHFGTINEIQESAEAREALEIAYDNFAMYTAWQLRNMTHLPGTPWAVTKQDSGLSSEIPIDLIKEYFDEEIME